MAAQITLQEFLSLSSTKVECVAFAEAAKTIAWSGNVRQKIGFKQDPTMVFHGNVGFIEWTNNGTARHVNKRRLKGIQRNFLLPMVEREK